MVSILIKAKNFLAADAEYRRWRMDQGDLKLKTDFAGIDCDSIVFDVGGYTGLWTEAISEKYGCAIHVFEPIPDFASQISSRFEGNDRIIVHAFGLGSANSRVLFSADGDRSSQFGENAHREVELRDISMYMKDRRIDRIDLMKINIEGGEYDLLAHMISERIIQKVGYLLVQFHRNLADSDTRMADIQSQISLTHDVVFQYRYVWELWKRRNGDELSVTAGR